MKHLVQSNDEQQLVMDITPESADWQYLSYRILRLAKGESYMLLKVLRLLSFH